MQKRLFYTSVLLLLIFLPFQVVTAQTQEVPKYDLVITGLTTQPEIPHAGDEAIFSVTYRNMGAESTPDTARVTILIKAYTTGEQKEEISTPCEEAAPGASGLVAGGEGVHKFDCPIRFPNEGAYRLEVSLSMNGGNFTDPENGNQFVVEPLTVAPYSSPLPDQFQRIFAGLGMFFAIMAIMALGTEVVIDNLKVMIGLKSKVSASAALERMEKLLPGKLAGLGVGAVEQSQVKSLIDDLKETIQPVTHVRFTAQNMKAGDFSDAYKEILDLMPQKGKEFAEDKLTELKDVAKKSIKALKDSGDRLRIPDEFTLAFSDKLEKNINTIEIDNAGDTLETVFKTVYEFGQNVSGEWLQGLLGQGRDEILRRFTSQLKPELLQMGLSPKDVELVKMKIDAALKVIDSKLASKTNVTVKSLNNLLQAVEDRRNATQSPLRKIWRRLRQSKFGILIVSLAITVVTLIFVNISWAQGDSFDLKNFLDILPWTQISTRFGANLIWFVLMFLIVMLILWLLGKWGICLYSGHSKDAIKKLSILYKVEILWNVIRGQGDIDPRDYGKERRLNEIFNLEPLSAENAAKNVLMLTDHHRDEEESRLRWLRVLSAFVGLVLAYLLQIDVAKLLDVAVPRLSETINIFRFSGEQLHKFWVIFPANLEITPGIILTGLAASAGSTFWHDQLDRLQATKKSAETAATVLQQVNTLSPKEE